MNHLISMDLKKKKTNPESHFLLDFFLKGVSIVLTDNTLAVAFHFNYPNPTVKVCKHS